MSNFWDNFTDDNDNINLDHAVFQQGRNLYETQRLLANQNDVNREKTKELLLEFCYLINAVGYLKAKHRQLQEETQEKKNLLRTLWEKWTQ